MIKTEIGLHRTAATAIKAANESRSAKLDWMGLENTLREILLQSPVKERNATVRLIDDALAAFTKRGNSLPELQ